MFGGSEKGKMVIEHKILLCLPFNSMPCNELPVKGLALVSSVWKVVKYWKWSPWKHRREKRSYGASGLFYPAFLRM